MIEMSKTLDTLPEIKSHLDECIMHWRRIRDEAKIEEGYEIVYHSAICYIDAYQSLRKTIFGEILAQ
jgi:hypothetical protein